MIYHRQWLILVLYGWVSALFAYCASLFTTSPLAAFAAVAGYQVVYFIVGTGQFGYRFLP